MATGQIIHLNTLAHLPPPTIISGYCVLCSSDSTAAANVTHEARYKCYKCAVSLFFAVRPGQRRNWLTKCHTVKRLFHVVEIKDGVCTCEQISEEVDVAESQSVSGILEDAAVSGIKCEGDNVYGSDFFTKNMNTDNSGATLSDDLHA